jgi:heme/copper-type cytochrome/quinol oxidase subunit 2
VIIPTPQQLRAFQDAKIKEKMEKKAPEMKLKAEEKARQNAETIKTISKYAVLVFVVISAFIGFNFFSKKSQSVGKVANKDLGISKKVVFAGVAILVLGFSIYAYNTLHKSSDRADRQSASSSVDPDPTGTWTGQ